MTTVLEIPRVAPRDLFNEGNLLKCIARLVELAEAGVLGGLRVRRPPQGETYQSFIDPDSGGLVVLPSFIDAPGAPTQFRFCRGCNSRESWPLAIETIDWVHIDLFDDAGALTQEALDFFPPSASRIEVSSAELFERSALFVALGQIALNACEDVGVVWQDYRFNGDAIFDGMLKIARDGHFLIVDPPGLVTHKGAPLPLRFSMRLGLEGAHAGGAGFQRFFDDAGQPTELQPAGRYAPPSGKTDKPSKMRP